MHSCPRRCRPGDLLAAVVARPGSDSTTADGQGDGPPIEAALAWLEELLSLSESIADKLLLTVALVLEDLHSATRPLLRGQPLICPALPDKATTDFPAVHRPRQSFEAAEYCPEGQQASPIILSAAGGALTIQFMEGVTRCSDAVAWPGRSACKGEMHPGVCFLGMHA